MTNRVIDTIQLNGRGIISLIGAGGKTSLMFCLAKEFADSGKTVLTTTTTKIFMPTPEQSSLTLIEEAPDKLIRKSVACLKDCHHFSAGSRYDSATGKLNGFSPHIIDQLWQADLFDWIIVEADGARQKPIKATDLHEPVIPKDTRHLILVTGLDAMGKPLDDHHVHRAVLFSNNTGLGMGQRLEEQSIAESIAVEIKKAGAMVRYPSFNFVFLNKADTRKRIDSGRRISNLLKKNKNIHQIFTGALQGNPFFKKLF